MPSRPWLPRVRPLLGVLTDAEVASRVGVSTWIVRGERARLGIKGRTGRDLDDIGAEETVRRVRARSKTGEPMRQGQVRNAHLLALCRRHFGGWYQAVVAAGLKPAGKPRVEEVARAIPNKRPLTPALLRGPKAAAELEWVTGVSRRAIRQRRAALGIVRSERANVDRSWLPSVRAQLGSVPDTEIARRVGISPSTIALARAELGIPRAVTKSRAASEVRDRPRKISKRDLAKLNPVDARIIEARYLRPRPRR